MLINQKSIKDIFTSFQSVFNNAFSDYEPQWKKIATEVSSTSKANLYGWLSKMPKMREWIGERFINKAKAYGYTLVNKKFEATIGVSRDDIEDNEIGVYKPLLEDAKLQSLEHPDELVFTALKEGHEHNCYDGKPFFHNAHPVGKNKVSNYTAGEGAAWFLLDTRRAIKPIVRQNRRDYELRQVNSNGDSYVFLNDEWMIGVDARGNAGYAFWQMAHRCELELNEENFTKVREQMEKLTDEEGKKLKVTPSVLVVGPSNRAKAEKLIGRQTIDGGDSNTLFKSVDVIVSPYLD